MNIHNSQKRDTFWGGNFSDQTIEKFLMRQLKTSREMTRGRGITDSTLAKWVHALPHCVPTCDELEHFTGVHTGTSEQYKDIQQSTRSRDNKERCIFVGWLQAHHHLLDTKLIAWSPCQLASSLAHLLIVINLYKSA